VTADLSGVLAAARQQRADAAARSFDRIGGLVRGIIVRMLATAWRHPLTLRPFRLGNGTVH
jgi:hypothetical protein